MPLVGGPRGGSRWKLSRGGSRSSSGETKSLVCFSRARTLRHKRTQVVFVYLKQDTSPETVYGIVELGLFNLWFFTNATHQMDTSKGNAERGCSVVRMRMRVPHVRVVPGE